MPTALVIDDERDIREEIEISLRARGYDTCTAASPGAAIELGCRRRPDLVVADWMLKDRTHGLYVCGALRTLRPNIRTILITGYASRDLVSAAGDLPVTDFIEKPFELSRLDEALNRTQSAATNSRLPAGILVVDAAGRFEHVNATARHALSEAGMHDAACMTELFAAEHLDRLLAAPRRWLYVAPRSGRLRWHACWRRWATSDGGVLGILPEAAAQERNHPYLRVLLDLSGPDHPRWPFPSHVLIVDADSEVRRRATAELEAQGCAVFATDSVPLALKLLSANDQIGIVVLDCDGLDGSVRETVRQLRSARGDLVLVGTSWTQRVSTAGLELQHELAKPWGAEELVNELTGRLGRCVDCGLELPLRRPRAGDVPSRWECAFCGSRYLGVLDTKFPDDLLRHVREIT